MLDPLDFENRPFLDALARKRKSAFFTLMVEKITLHVWRLFFWVLLFMGLWMLEVPQFFGLVGKAITSLMFIAGVVFFYFYDVRKFSFPSANALDQRLEAESRMLQGSILTLQDRLANPKKHDTRDLWTQAQKQILGILPSLKRPLPKAILARKDPYALRFVAVLLFLSGLFMAGPDWSSRVWEGFLPITPQFSFADNKTINLWIKPPQYTGAAQIHLTGGETPKDGLAIPQGSEIKARVYSPLGQFLAPYFGNGSTSEKMHYIGEGLYRFDGVVARGGTLSVTQGFLPRARWSYAFVEDLPPTIMISKPDQDKDEKTAPETPEAKPKDHEVLPNSQLRFPLTVKDDYSVTDLVVKMSLDPIAEDKPMGKDYNETRLVMSPPGVDFKIIPLYDLTWHTWAGLPVIFEFEAKDNLGQSAKLAPIKLILPERSFENPVAKSLIAVRKKIAWSKEHDFTELSHNLATLLTAPDFFKNNPVVYLAIKTASARLLQSEMRPLPEKLETAQAVIDLLWDTAVALEDGALSLALSALKDAQKELEEALRDPATPQKEIDRLMDNLQSKIQEYFSALQKEMQDRMAEGKNFPMISPDQLGQMISPESLSSFLEQLQSEMKSGNKNKAQEMLSQLQRMMDMMDPSMNTPMPEDMKMMSEGVNELQELIERQEKLLDQTQKQAEAQSLLDSFKPKPSTILPPDLDMLKKLGIDGFPPAPEQQIPEESPADKESTKTEKSKSEQEALRYILGQLMMEAGEHLDEIPESMGKAEMEMRGSEKELGDNKPADAAPHQEKALEHLKQSQKDMGEQLKKRMQQMVGIGLSGGMRYDPLGRPYGGQGSKNAPEGQDKVKIPDEAQKKKVEEILRLLRDRSGEFQRPAEELDYYRRLLRQF